MRATPLLSALALMAGCFSDPGTVNTAGPGSTGAGTTSTTATSEGAATGADDGTTGGVTTEQPATTNADTLLPGDSSSSTGGDPAMGFCAMAVPPATQCISFEDPVFGEWVHEPEDGVGRVFPDNPAEALSPPAFVEYEMTAEGGSALSARTTTTIPPNDIDGFEFRLSVRFDPDTFDGACNDAGDGVPVFELAAVRQGAVDTISGWAGPENFYVWDPGQDIFRRNYGEREVSWYELSIELVRGQDPGEVDIIIQSPDGMQTDTITTWNMDEAELIEVSFGPNAPAAVTFTDCRYSIDNVTLRLY